METQRTKERMWDFMALSTVLGNYEEAEGGVISRYQIFVRSKNDMLPKRIK
jgi:hypothetical protein